jgi:hypothetical protein
MKYEEAFFTAEKYLNHCRKDAQNAQKVLSFLALLVPFCGR